MAKNNKMTEEKTMTDDKKKLEVTLTGDGMLPVNLPWGLGLRLPLPVLIEPNSRRKVAFNVTLDVPCLVVPMRRLTESELSLEEDGKVTPAGQNITLTVINHSNSPRALESRDILVSLYPLDWDGTVVAK